MMEKPLTATLELIDFSTQDNIADSPEPDPGWGRLYPVAKGLHLVELRDAVYTFGRGSATDVDVSLDSDEVRTHKNFQAYSKVHFKISREIAMSQTIIEDLSSNGTFINKEKLGKKKRRVLNTGDEIAMASVADKVYVYIETGTSEYENAPGDLLKKYVVSRQLGKGGMGEVRLIFDKETCARRMAVKIIAKNRFLTPGGTSQDLSRQIAREIDILKNMDHPGIVKVYDVFDSPDKTFIIMELVDGGELFDRISKSDNHRLPEAIAKLYFYQIFSAVKYLHSMNITHRDLKPENILLATDDPVTLVKVTDFGLSKLVDSSSMLKTFCGTPNYLAPEILQSAGTGTYTKAVDIWSLGVVLFVALAGYMPFSPEYKDLTLRDQILQGRYRMYNSYWTTVSRQALNLVKRMLTVDPSSRPTADDVLNDAWMQDGEVKRTMEWLRNPEEMDESSLKRSADEETSSGSNIDGNETKKRRCDWSSEQE